MEDLQDIIDNISDEQDPVSTSLKAVISKLKKRNKLIKIVDSTEGGWAVVAEYEKESIGSNSDDCKRIRQAETRALKKKNTEKSKSSAFKPSSTLRNPRIGQQFRNAISITITLQQVVAADRIPSNTGRICTPNIQIPANLGNLGVKPRQQIIASDVVSKGIGDGHAQKENSHTTEDKIKGNNYNYFIEALHGNYGGEQKIGEYEESVKDLYFRERQPQKTPFFLGKNDKSKRNNV